MARFLVQKGTALAVVQELLPTQINGLQAINLHVGQNLYKINYGDSRLLVYFTVCVSVFNYLALQCQRYSVSIFLSI